MTHNTPTTTGAVEMLGALDLAERIFTGQTPIVSAQDFVTPEDTAMGLTAVVLSLAGEVASLKGTDVPSVLAEQRAKTLAGLHQGKFDS